MALFDDLTISRDVPGIQVPSLFGGRERGYGIDYPTGYKPTTTEKSMSVLERGEKAKQTELEAEARRTPMLDTRSTRDKLIDTFNKKFGDPDTSDSAAKTTRIMDDEQRDIKRSLGLGPDAKLKGMSPRMRVLYEKLRMQREQTVYGRVENRRLQLKAQKDSVIGAFDARMKRHLISQEAHAERQHELNQILLRERIKPPKRSWDSFAEFGQGVEKFLMKQFLDPRKTTYEGLGPQDKKDLDVIISSVQSYMTNKEKANPGWWKSGAAWIEINEHRLRTQKLLRQKREQGGERDKDYGGFFGLGGS